MFSTEHKTTNMCRVMFTVETVYKKKGNQSYNGNSIEKKTKDVQDEKSSTYTN